MKMNKTMPALLALILVLTLSACQQAAESPNENRDRDIDPENFLVVVERASYEENDDRTWSWADVRSVTEAEVDTEYVLVYGYTRGTYRVELNQWNTADEEIRDMPVVHPHDFGDVQRVRTFDWTPREEGEYNFTLWISDQDGDPRPDTPIERTVTVGEDGSGDSDNLSGSNLINYLNITLSDGEHVSDGDEVAVEDGHGFSVNWGVVSDVDDVTLTIDIDGDEVYDSSRESYSRYIAFADYDEGDVEIRLEVERGDERDVAVIEFELEGNYDSARGSGRIEFSVEVDGGDLDSEDFALNLEASDGAYIDTYTDGDEARVSEGRYYIVAPPNLGYALSDADGDCTQVDDHQARVSVDEDETVECILEFEYDGESPVADRVIFDIDEDVSFTIHRRSNGNALISGVEDGEEVALGEGEYRAVIDDNHNYVVDSVAGDCTRVTAAIVDFDIDEDEGVFCRIEIEPR